MGNCLNCNGNGQPDNTNLLANSSDAAVAMGTSQDVRLTVPYNEMAGNYYPQAPIREQGSQFAEMGISSSIGVGVNLAIGGEPIVNEDEQQLRMAKRIGLIQHLPTQKFDGTKKGECVICMMELVTDEEVRYLPCMHIYHAVCIDDWLLRSLTCPTCMEPVDAALINSYHPTT